MNLSKYWYCRSLVEEREKALELSCNIRLWVVLLLPEVLWCASLSIASRSAVILYMARYLSQLLCRVFASHLCALHARASQQFCTFCFHNLHTCLLFCPSLRIEMRELQQKTWEFFQQISHVFQIISDLLLHISDFLQNSHSFHEKLIVLCRSTFCSFSSLLPPLFLYFLALQYATLKECL